MRVEEPDGHVRADSDIPESAAPPAPDARAPRVSVVVPTYNHASILPRCIEAVLAQDYPAGEFELILVDDGSSDNTAAVAAKYLAHPTVPVRYLNQRNRGPAAARNRGAEAARGDILVFTDDDCEPERDWLREMTRPLQNDPGLAAVKGAYRTRQSGLIARFAQAEFEERYRKLAQSERIDFVDTYSAAFRASVFRSLGGFNTSFPQANNEDVEFSYRMASEGFSMAFNPAAIVYHGHPATLFGYLQKKFGRAYWRMVVYRDFPAKIRADSYTPLSLKVQIVLTMLLFAFGVGALVFPRREWRYVLLAMVPLFLLSVAPFCLHLLRLSAIESFLASVTCGLRHLCRCAHHAVDAVGRLAGRCLRLLAPLRAVAQMMRSLAWTASRVLSSRCARQVARVLRGSMRAVATAGAAGARGLASVGRGLGRGARMVALGPAHVFRLLGRGPLARWLNRGWHCVTRTRIALALAAPVLLFLRAAVMALGVLWGLKRQHVVRERFSRVTMLVVTDVLSVAASYIGVYGLRLLLLGSPVNPKCPVEAYLSMGFLLVALCVGAFSLSGLYRPSEGVGRIHEMVQTVRALFWVALGLIVGMYWTRYVYSRIIIAALFIVLPITTTTARGLTRWLWRLRQGEASDKTTSKRLLIVGLGEMAAFVSRKMESAGSSVTVREIVGFVAPSGALAPESFCGRAVLGGVDELAGLINEERITDVIVALPQAPQDTLMTIIDRASRTRGVHCHIISDVFDLMATETDLTASSGISIAYLHNENMPLLHMLVKRMVDVAFSALVIVATLPLWCVIWLAIRMESKGPAVFKQERVGLKGRTFRVYKFRTMYAHTPRFEYSPRQGDRRVTRVGRFLRMTSLDELPQFINVLKGEMSVVGPRPEMPFIVAKYTEWEKLRLNAKPGVTGLWQILGRKDLPLHESVEFDFYYIKNQSLILDLVIILRTVGVVLSGKGAY